MPRPHAVTATLSRWPHLFARSAPALYLPASPKSPSMWILPSPVAESNTSATVYLALLSLFATAGDSYKCFHIDMSACQNQSGCVLVPGAARVLVPSQGSYPDFSRSHAYRCVARSNFPLWQYAPSRQRLGVPTNQRYLRSGETRRFTSRKLYLVIPYTD